MANNFAEKVTKYFGLLDEVFRKGAITGMLEVSPATVGFEGTKYVKIPKFYTDGLGNYDRTAANPFVGGSATLEWIQYELRFDRGREFTIDVLEDEEIMFLGTVNLFNEFMNGRVIQEVDSIRFSTIAQNIIAKAGTNGNEVTGTIDNTNILTEWDKFEKYCIDNELPLEEMIIFCSSTFYQALKTNTTLQRMINIGQFANGVIDRTVTHIDKSPLLTVPKNRFYTKYIMQDGKTAGQETGGLVVDTVGGAKEINFMAVHPSAAKAITKHQTVRQFAPDVNQKADAWLFQYRLFHDLISLDNKIKACYIHHKA